MRKILLSSASLLLLTAGVALAGNHHGDGTNVSIPVIKNAGAGGSGTNSSATTGGTAVSASVSKSLNDNLNTTSSNNTANSNNESILKAWDGGTVLSNSVLSSSSSHTKVDVTLASAVASGNVSGNRVENEPREAHLDAGAKQSFVNGGTGIMSAQQNTGANSLQQTSVALNSIVSGSTPGGNSGH